jgi:hypothetical protein
LYREIDAANVAIPNFAGRPIPILGVGRPLRELPRRA